MTILYEKRGRRYHPVMMDDWYRDHRLMDMVKPGAMLVIVDDYCKHYIHNVDTARAEVLAALKECREAIGTAMHRAAEFKPKSEKLSVRHQKAYAAYQAAIPKAEREALWAGSIADALDAAIKVLEERVGK